MRVSVFRILTFVLLVTLVLLIFAAESADGSSSGHGHRKKPLDPDDELMEYDLRKQKKAREKYCRNQERTNKNLPYKRLCTKFNRNYLKFYLSLFLMVSVGAIVRTILRVYDVNLPYTVLLIIVGLLAGLGTRNDVICVPWSMLTWISRTPPKIILNVFLPVLVYESAFSMKAHIFLKSSISIVILALPGMIITTFLTASVCMQFFLNYHWDFKTASLYGSIISATDPVAVVAILKEIGTSEMLTVMIEGESLLNDGIAILMYEIFLEILKSAEGNLGLRILTMFCQITLGGPAFGWLVGKACVIFLSRIFNDAAVEVSITLVAAYLTYFIGESFLGVSGVMAVVTLGIVMSVERTCISPEVQSLVHHFWEMVGYLGNTVLFIMVGVVISETAINNITMSDVYYLIFLYFSLNIARLIMIVILSPFLTHVGYGLTWQNMIVMTWGGLRGAVGICLSLEVFKDRYLCGNINIGPKFLLQTAGIVILTLLVNGTTTKCLLNMLKLTQLSIGKLQDMSNAVRQIQAAQQRSLAVLKHDRFLADSNWEIVTENTRFDNPYARNKVQPKSKRSNQDAHDATLLVDDDDDYDEDHHVICPSCDEDVEIEPTPDEYRELTEEARLRLLKAMKVSCWRQFDQGVITEEAVQVLVEYLETCEDKPFQMFHSEQLKKYWIVKGCLAWLRDKLLPHTLHLSQPSEVIPPPTQEWRMKFYNTAEADWFDGFVHMVIIVNMVPIIWEAVYIIMDKIFTPYEVILFLLANGAFCAFYIFEFVVKVVGWGPGGYCSSKWNVLDCLILMVTIAEMTLSLSFVSQNNDIRDYQDRTADTDFLKFLRFIRLLRITRALRLFKPLVSPTMKFLNSRINVFLFLGYDIGKGLATAIDDVRKFLPQMVDNHRVFNKFKSALEEQRQRLVLEMGLLQKDHPGIAIAVKTRHASRGVLNQMRESLMELKEDGLVDDKEFEILLKDIEGKMKRLWDSPPFMLPPRAEMLLANLQWVAGNKDLLAFILKEATILHFAVGDVIYSVADPPNGIYVIISGVVKISYEPLYDRLKLRDDKGIIPNVEMYSELMDDSMTDYFTCGGVLGEMGVVTGNDRAGAVTCETGVRVFHISQEAMKTAMEKFDDRYDSLESRIWRAVGMKIAAVVLPSQPAFQSWTLDKLKTHLELSAVPVGEQYLEMTIPPFITETILIYGQVCDADREDRVFTAPCVLPHNINRIKPAPQKPLPENAPPPKDPRIHLPKVLVIANEDLENEDIKNPDELNLRESFSTASVHKCILARKNRNYIIEEEVMNLKRPTIERENLEIYYEDGELIINRSKVSQNSASTESDSGSIPTPPTPADPTADTPSASGPTAPSSEPPKDK